MEKGMRELFSSRVMEIFYILSIVYIEIYIYQNLLNLPLKICVFSAYNYASTKIIKAEKCLSGKTTRYESDNQVV